MDLKTRFWTWWDTGGSSTVLVGGVFAAMIALCASLLLLIVSVEGRVDEQQAECEPTAYYVWVDGHKRRVHECP